MPSIEVAVKTLRPGRENSGALEDLMSEAMVSAQLDHENIVKLVGVVTIGQPALLVLHMCSKGSLEVKYILGYYQLDIFTRSREISHEFCRKRFIARYDFW